MKRRGWSAASTIPDSGPAIRSKLFIYVVTEENWEGGTQHYLNIQNARCQPEAHRNRWLLRFLPLATMALIKLMTVSETSKSIIRLYLYQKYITKRWTQRNCKICTYLYVCMYISDCRVNLTIERSGNPTKIESKQNSSM